jgi:hypothetical protein
MNCNPSLNLFKRIETCFCVSAGMGEGDSTREHILNNFCNTVLKR